MQLGISTSSQGIQTVVIRGDLRVLAKQTKYGVTAKTFANRMQAASAAAGFERMGIDCDVVCTGRPFYVVFR